MWHKHLHSFGMPHHTHFKFVSNDLVAKTYTSLPNAGRRCTATRTLTRARQRVQARVHANTHARTHARTHTHTHTRIDACSPTLRKRVLCWSLSVTYLSRTTDLSRTVFDVFDTKYTYILSRTIFVPITWHTDACNPDWENGCCVWPVSVTHNKMYISSSWQIYSAWQIFYVSCSWQIRYVCCLWPLSSDTQQICHVQKGCHELDLYFFLDTYFPRTVFHICVTSYTYICHELWLSRTHDTPTRAALPWGNGCLPFSACFPVGFTRVWHDSFICVTCLTLICDMTHSYVWHDSLIRVTWLIHMCDMTHSYVWHDSFICVTWLIHMCDMTHSYVW